MIIPVQGWSSIFPKFMAVDFVSFYVEIPVMIVMCTAWMLIKRPRSNSSAQTAQSRRFWYSDLVDVNTVDLSKDEYHDEESDHIEDETRIRRMTKGNLGMRILWRLYYVVA
jgi:AAT family amino acid transporter